MSTKNTPPAKRNTTPTKSPSPRRNKGKPASLKDKLNKKPGTNTTLTIYAMDPSLNTELVLYSKGNDDDGFLAKYKKYTDGDIQCAALEEANFTGLLYRRKVGTDNQIMVDSKRYWRRVIVRHPIGGVSTTESRAEGLAVLRATFLSTELSDYPPSAIETIDATDEENPHALDMFLQDSDIVAIIKEQLVKDELNNRFYTDFHDCAKRLWSGSIYPAFARDTLGFP